MLNFIDKYDYKKPTFQQISPTEISWQYQDEKGRNHSGFFIAGQKSSHMREISQDGNELKFVEFEPFAEVLELGLVPEFDKAAYDAKIATEQKEATRIALKNKREADLQAIIHDFGDGRIVQVRPQDIGMFQLAIDKGTDTRWIMKDNTVAVLTVEELQDSLDIGLSKIEDIYNNYMDNFSDEDLNY